MSLPRTPAPNGFDADYYARTVANYGLTTDQTEELLHELRNMMMPVSAWLEVLAGTAEDARLGSKEALDEINKSMARFWWFVDAVQAAHNQARDQGR